MKLKVIESIVHCGFIVGCDDGMGFTQKSYARTTRKEAQDLCDKWKEDFDKGLIPNFELL